MSCTKNCNSFGRVGYYGFFIDSAKITIFAIEKQNILEGKKVLKAGNYKDSSELYPFKKYRSSKLSWKCLHRLIETVTKAKM